ncbi:phenylalanine--tRNA ligase subunit beta [Stakelama pacifica]|uniref:Phenylalanine--tRNA ligase beta subunit n=1 Tax=Stakelama pacifica TaxID=517720 RepID=A0A4R6FU81_9SPHN|nr:phenylalanine--tRNA ligase subunit beta [Stakelama pacifica]TDN85429.1 phenylalanyl-tRNA synthetase beta subunit [Stakelama pacifica]GGO92670.1 phenylalanine--tRNA ligase beta subunit [Stakelama pacifica]
MKFTLGWLKQHLDTDADIDTVAEALTRIGLEVEGIENPGEKLSDFIVARVLEAKPHPDADKLQVLSVDAGGEPQQVVCGAPNARTGLIGVFGPPGAYVPGSDFTLKVAAIRGVTSNGMMCSVRELELGDSHDGIIELSEDALGAVGTPYPEFAGLNDPVIDIAITPNRQDCMGVRGVARDLAAAGLGTLKPLDQVYAEFGGTAPVEGEGDGPDIAIEDQEGCPAFYAQRVSGVANGEAPEWMKRRLTAIGQRPISALVDITNFVMIDLGRPLHVYDLAKLDGGLVARKAKPGESVVALNEKAYTLDETMTVIADSSAVHDIGGIMGGEHSGVADTTSDVLIECAYFTPEAIAKTGQKLNLTSDARQRFERGVDPAFLDEGLAIATRLVTSLCGGSASGITRAGNPPAEPRSVAFKPEMARTLGGIDLDTATQTDILTRLGFEISADGTQAIVPTWRRDVTGPADLVEEVVRIHGIDNVPSQPLPRPAGVAQPTATWEQKLERKLRRAAATRGFHEAITWSFISESDAAIFGGGNWTLANPISEDMKVMRPSLLPGLLTAAQRNLAHSEDSVRLFELGRRYIGDTEHPTLTLVMAGDAAPRSWRTGKARSFDGYDAKEAALALLEAAGAPVANLLVMGDAGDAWHPGRSATLRLGPKNVLATFGVLHPRVLKALDLDGPVAAVEIFLDAIPEKRSTGFLRPAYTPAQLQPVTRDFAFLVDADMTADTLIRAVKGADKKAITDARLFDVFTGAGVAEGKKSLAIEITLQPGDKSFTDEELKAIADKVVAAAAKQGATLRG